MKEPKHDKSGKFQDISEKTIKYGNENSKFIKVAKTKYTDTSSNRESVFVGISVGDYYEGNQRFKSSISIPNKPEVVSQVIEALKDLIEME